MDKIVQIKYARGLQDAKNKICLILGADEDGSIVLARSSNLNWKISADLVSHLVVNCSFTFRKLQKLNLLSGRYIKPTDIIRYVKYRIWIS